MLFRSASIAEGQEQDVRRCYDAMRESMVRGDPYYNINYDYALSEPRAAVRPVPPININPVFSEK